MRLVTQIFVSFCWYEMIIVITLAPAARSWDAGGGTAVCERQAVPQVCISNRIWCSLKMIEEGFTFQSNIIWVYNFCDQDIEATTGASKAWSWRSNPEGEEEVSSRIPPPPRTQTSQGGRRYYVWDQSWPLTLLHIRLKGHSLTSSYNLLFLSSGKFNSHEGMGKEGYHPDMKMGDYQEGAHMVEHDHDQKPNINGQNSMPFQTELSHLQL